MKIFISTASYQHRFFSAMTVVVLISSLFIFWPKPATAQIPFGGRIVSVIPCTCNWMFGNPAILINQIPAAGPPQLIFQMGYSRLYSYFQLVPGMWILGNTLGMSTCWIGIVPFCAPIGPLAPLISIVGTSGAGMATGSGTTGTNQTNNNTSTNNPNSTPGTGPAGGNPQAPDPCADNDLTRPAAYTAANEGCRNNRYIDSLGNPTIGCGHKITGNEGFNTSGTISNDQIRQLYNNDYALARNGAQAAAIAHGINWDSLSPTRQAVLTDMAFNMGAVNGGLSGFNRMWGALAGGDYNQAGDEIIQSTYRSQVGNRAVLNANMMRSDNSTPMNRKISNDPWASGMCVQSA